MVKKHFTKPADIIIPVAKISQYPIIELGTNNNITLFIQRYIIYKK
jgi:hypothetical protein